MAGLWQSQYSGDSWDKLASWTVRISDGFTDSPTSLNKVESYRDRQFNVNFWPLHMCAHACTHQVQGQRVLSGPRPRARKEHSVLSGSSFWGMVYRRSPVPNTQRAEGNFTVWKDGRFVMGQVTIMCSLARGRRQNGDNT